MYVYLLQHKLPIIKAAIRKVKTLAEGYIVLDSLLFNLVTTPEKETVLLTIPKSCSDKIISLYHSSPFAGHQGVIKTYFTIGNEFFIPGLRHHQR